MFSTIRPTSPDPSTYADLPQDQDYWGCQHWRTYYDRNKQSLGKAKAIEIFRVDSDRIGWWADLYKCKYDCDFVNYFENEMGENVGNIFSKVYCGASTIVTTAHDGIKLVNVLTPALMFTAAFVGYNYLKKENYI